MYCRKTSLCVVFSSWLGTSLRFFWPGLTSTCSAMNPYGAYDPLWNPSSAFFRIAADVRIPLTSDSY
jgi:hypothetical protein